MEEERLRTFYFGTDAMSVCSTESETIRFFESDSDTLSNYSRPLTPRRSSLLSLPYEIRFLIYQHAFSHSPNWNELIRITVDRDHQSGRSKVLFKPPRPQIKLKYTRDPPLHLPVALLTTCHQIYREALPVLLSCVNFGFLSNPTSLTFLLDRFSETAKKSIRYLRLYPAPLYVGNGPLGEQLSWSVLCAQVARLPSLKRVNVFYNRVEDLKLNPVELQRLKYGKGLALINARIEPEFESTPAEVEKCRSRFYEIIAPATKAVEA
ncbi:hypothetical protein BJY04DRAFT_220898 [Aspergillus karnatakaensis]|uniref:uncharacterized protein n=1 Tax=Aspergillus karnatakaensis TaxID=1810916 RepID=UPI003CCDDD5D